jgi:hypothetical protein
MRLKQGRVLGTAPKRYCRADRVSGRQLGLGVHLGICDLGENFPLTAGRMWVRPVTPV